MGKDGKEDKMKERKDESWMSSFPNPWWDTSKSSKLTPETRLTKSLELFKAARNGETDVVEEILAEYEGIDVDAIIKYDSTPSAPLHQAVKSGSLTIVRLLMKVGCNLNIQDGSERTALHYAVEYGHHQIVQLLVESGARLDVRDQEGKIPLHYASGLDKPDCCELILKKDPNLVNVRCALQQASPLSIACDLGSAKTLQTVLNCPQVELVHPRSHKSLLVQVMLESQQACRKAKVEALLKQMSLRSKDVMEADLVACCNPSNPIPLAFLCEMITEDYEMTPDQRKRIIGVLVKNGCNALDVTKRLRRYNDSRMLLLNGVREDAQVRLNPHGPNLTVVKLLLATGHRVHYDKVSDFQSQPCCETFSVLKNHVFQPKSLAFIARAAWIKVPKKEMDVEEIIRNLEIPHTLKGYLALLNEIC